MRRGIDPDRAGDLADAERRAAEQFAGLAQAELQQVLLGGDPEVAAEDPEEVRAVDAEVLGHGGDRDGHAERPLDVADRTQGVLFGHGPRRRGGGAVLLDQAGQEQVQVPDRGDLLEGGASRGLAHGLDALPEEVVAVAAEDGGFGEPGQGEQRSGAGAVEADPAIGPRVLGIGFVVGHFGGADEEAFSLAEVRLHATAAVGAATLEDVVDEKMVAHGRTVGVARLAALPAAVVEGEFPARPDSGRVDRLLQLHRAFLPSECRGIMSARNWMEWVDYGGDYATWTIDKATPEVALPTLLYYDG